MQTRKRARTTAALCLFTLIGFLIGSFLYGSVAKADYTYTAEIDGTAFPYEIKAGGIYRVTGKNLAIPATTGGILVKTSDPVTLVLDNANYGVVNGTSSANSKYSALVIGTALPKSTQDPMVPDIQANVTIILKAGSTNSLISMSECNQSDANTAGINVKLGSKLTITSEDADTSPGSLTVKGGWYAAGIGAGPNQKAGQITIEGGIITAESAASGVSGFPGTGNGAGIGGGGGSSYCGGNSEGIIIRGYADVTAKSFGEGAGIGGGAGGAGGACNGLQPGPATGGNIQISGNATVTASALGLGAGIGGAGRGRQTGDAGVAAASGGNIQISGNANVTANVSRNGAGIGGAGSELSYTAGDSGTIIISGNAVVNTYVKGAGAGIGAGGANQGGIPGAATYIHISGGDEQSSPSAASRGPTVITHGSIYGIDIGAGCMASPTNRGSEGTIIITSGNVYAPKTQTVTNGMTFGNNSVPLVMIEAKSRVPGEPYVWPVNSSTFPGVAGLGSYNYAAWPDASGSNTAYVWVPYAYQVTYAPDTSLSGTTFGPIPVDPEHYVHHDTIAVLPAPGYWTAGYAFQGWVNSIDGKLYEEGQTFSITTNTTLTAQWGVLCSVTFDTDGGDIVPSQDVPSGGTASLPAPEPTKAGFVFTGWYKEPARVIPWDFSANTITAPTTIYAKWTALAILSDDCVTKYSDETTTLQVQTNIPANDFSLTGAPAGVTIHPTTGLMTFDQLVPVDTYTFTSTASNGLGANATQQFTLVVVAREIMPLPITGDDFPLELLACIFILLLGLTMIAGVRSKRGAVRR